MCQSHCSGPVADEEACHEHMLEVRYRGVINSFRTFLSGGWILHLKDRDLCNFLCFYAHLMTPLLQPHFDLHRREKQVDQYKYHGCSSFISFDFHPDAILIYYSRAVCSKVFHGGENHMLGFVPSSEDESFRSITSLQRCTRAIRI